MKTTSPFASFILLMIIILVFISALSSTYSQSIYLEMVSVRNVYTEGNQASTNSAISDDGQYVAFISYASNLVANDTNGNNPDIFIRDRVLGITELALIGLNGTQANSGIYQLDISDDGRYIAFNSDATNLVPNTPTDN